MKLKAYTVILTSALLYSCLGPQFYLKAKAHNPPQKIASVPENVKRDGQGQTVASNVPKQVPTDLPGGKNKHAEDHKVLQESSQPKTQGQHPHVQTTHASAKGPKIGGGAKKEAPPSKIPTSGSQDLVDNIPKVEASGENRQESVPQRPCLPHEAPGHKVATAESALPPDGSTVQLSPPGDTKVPGTQDSIQETAKHVPPPTSQDNKDSTIPDQDPPKTIPGPKAEPPPQTKPLSPGDQKDPGTQSPGSPPIASPDEDPTEPPKGGGEVPPPSDDILSFDEWKQKMLAEHSQQLKSKQLEAQSVSDSVINGKTGKLKASSSRHNYAALSCGAKVLATNQEAVNPSAILTENKDQYMIQPCKAKKWFVVELCESVQVRNIEIANLELFSSLPETFIAHVSDRYPSKDWKTLGTFHARDERAVQTFSVSDEELFAKFMKIEMVSHYGSEHYCPLTLLRVYGVVEEEDDDGEPVISHEEVDASMQAEEGEDADSEPQNLFKSATDTVMKLVKNVLNPTEKEEKEDKEQNMDDVVHMNTTLAKNASRVNDTASATDDMLPCLPGDGPDESKPQTEGDGSGEGPSAPIVTHLGPSDEEDTLSKKSSVVTLIETPSAPLSKILSTCVFCDMPESVTFLSNRASVCGYYRAVSHVPKMSCRSSKKKNRGLKKIAGNKENGVLKNGKSSSEGRPAETNGIPSNQPEMSESQGKGQGSSVHPKSKQPGNTPSVSEITNGVSDKIPSGTVDATASAPHPTSDSSTSSLLSSSTEHQIQPSAGTGEAPTSQPTMSLPDTPTSTIESSPTENLGMSVDMTTTTEQVIPSPTEETVAATDAPVKTEPEKPPENGKLEPGKAPEMPAGKEEVPSVDVPHESKPTVSPPVSDNGRKDIYAEEAALDRDLDIEGVEVPDLEEPVQKLSSAGKQTTFMRLKNRIKALELNLNLSSRYLEELSQRYKKQMEEMYTSINSTITRLSNTSRASEERYQHQQVYQKELQEQIYRLTTNLTALQADIAGIHTQVIERHLYLMIIEVMVFILVLTFCLHRQPANNMQVDRITSQQIPQKLVGKSKNNESGRVQNVKHHRRNSVDATPPRPKPQVELTPKRSVDDIGVNRRSESDDGLPIVQPTVPTIVGPELNLKNFEGNSKKRKKKKVPTATLR